MADVRCPMCGKPNPQDLEECQYCGARIKPVLPSTRVDSQALKPGEEPIKRDTSEFEKVKLNGEGPIHPGEAPTKKNTGELERALPSWLRSLREGKRPVAGESLAEPSSDEGLPAGSQARPGPDSSSGLPDWLSGLGKAASDDEEVPDWLADMRVGKASESTPAAAVEGEQAPELGNEDWMGRLGNETPEAKPPPADTKQLPKLELPAFEAPPEPAQVGNLPDWLKNLQSPGSAVKEPPADAQGGENISDWLSGLSGNPAESRPDLSGTEAPAPAESMPDWLDQLKQESITNEAGAPAEGGQSVPDWLSSFESVPAAPSAAPGENVPEWLSNLESKPEPESGTPAAIIDSEPSSAGNPPAEKPDWLSRLQAEANVAEQVERTRDGFEVVSETPASPGSSEPLPDWLAGIADTSSSSSGTPALFVDNQDTPPSAQDETAFPMEGPDWLSKLSPERGTEKAADNKDEQPDSEQIETTELPSWVQAMRPVEAVVESKSTSLDENQVTELSGPLAGLRGVLPAEPGLGLLRKPPAYSSKIQVSNGQHRYATSLQQLVAGETHPRTLEKTRLPSNRLWRWCIAGLLLLAVGLPFVSGAHFAPGTLLLPSDKGASSKIIEELSANVPVLVAFDYDPALSGELEVVAAPIMDQLLSKGTPLALISTSPTGPALAEHFLRTTSLVNVHQYQSGEQYVNLGYLAGGPAGILYLADSVTDAMPISVDGKSAWKTGPLLGIQSLSNFAAVIILTDNADTGRNWIEQAGPRLADKPMLMIISAQAEPMIRPYFDSGQLKGLVSGLSDAKIYEQNYNRPGLANHYWNSFSVGMLVAELLIAAGAILGFMANRRFTRKDSRGEA
jgi:hypothetical protein